MGCLAVVAFPQKSEQVRHDQQRRWSCEQQAADNGARQRGILFSAGAADRHRDHADDHGRRRHQHRPNPGVAGSNCSVESRLACYLLLAGEGDEQDRVRRRDADRHDRSHQRGYVKRRSGDEEHRDNAA